MRGRVVRIAGLQCLVEVDGHWRQCELRGRFKEGLRKTTSPVVVGDWVEIAPTGPQSGIIEAILPRASQFSRKASGSHRYEQVIAVNLDQLVVVAAIRQPALSPGFIDRAVIMGLKGGIKPLICLNKVDLDPDGKRFAIGQVYQNLGYPVYYTSVYTGEGIHDFRQALGNQTSGIVGQSGVGKSSLLNCIDPTLSIRTQQLMKQHDRGRHTTSNVWLYPLSGGGYVADTPGIKELQLWGVERNELVHYFTEMTPLVGECRFRNCVHLHEPGCAVRNAVEAGEIAAIRYEGYRRIMDSL